MTQDAIVTKILPDGMAEVVVTRSTACGGNCGSCESCMFQSELRALARDNIGCKPGQRVVIETKTSRVFGAAMLVYVMPLLFFLNKTDREEAAAEACCWNRCWRLPSRHLPAARDGL